MPSLTGLLNYVIHPLIHQPTILGLMILVGMSHLRSRVSARGNGIRARLHTLITILMHSSLAAQSQIVLRTICLVRQMGMSPVRELALLDLMTLRLRACRRVRVNIIASPEVLHEMPLLALLRPS